MFDTLLFHLYYTSRIMVISAKNERFYMGREDPHLVLVVDKNKRAYYVNRGDPSQHRRQDELLSIMNNYYRNECTAYEEILTKRNRELRIQDLRYATLGAYTNDLYNDYHLLFRICREIFEDNEDIREMYSLMIQFEGLERDQPHPLEPLPVRRRLNFDHI
jgi:hypothetical protein